MKYKSQNPTLDTNPNTTCPDVLSITNNIKTGTDINYASDTLMASNVISPGATAIYKVGKVLLLKDGFVASNGSHFITSIEDCSGKRSDTFDVSPPNEIAIKKQLVDQKSKAIQDLMVYPNPANNNIQLNYPFKKNIKYTALIFNITGQPVLESEIDNNQPYINLELINNGIYLLKIYSENTTQLFKTKTIIIQK